MGVTRCIRAARPVLNGSDNPQYPQPATPINTKPVRTFQASQRLRLRVTSVASLSSFVYAMVDLGRIGGIADSPLLVEDPHADHARFVGDGAHEVVQSFAVVAQHVVRGAALDNVTDAFCADEGSCFKVLAA